MHVNLRVTKCLQGIIKSKALILVGLLLLSFTSFKASAHSVQVGYVVLPNGFLRVYIEHWHGALSTAQLVGNGMSITTTYGSTTLTQNVNPTGAFNGYAWNNLPGAGTNIIILATSARSNWYNNWAYYDFAPAACGVPVNITLNGGLTVVLTESEPQIWPRTISATFNDNAPPTITPANTNTTVACGVSGANVNFSATAIDNCTPNPAVTFSVAPGSFFPVGTTPVTAYSSDANGNSGQLTFNVTVSVVDNTPPVISCPANISVGTNPTSCSAIVNYALPTYSDNCGVATIQQISGLASGSTFPKGNTTNTFKVTDGSGNSTTCSFVVSVIDDAPPTARCMNATVAINAGLTAGITVADINNGSYDNCGPVTVSISSGKTSFDCNDVGQTFPVTLLVTDQQGNTSTCTANVSVTDPNSYCNQPPVAVCQPLTLSANANCQGTAVASDFNNGSSDPNGDSISFSVSPAGPYNIGTTNVTLTVTDSKGASSSCVTTVTVVDDTKPIITAPVNIAVSNDAGQCGATISIGSAVTGDNCGVASVVNNHPSTSYPVGTTVVTWTVTDIHGNTNTATQTVTVTDEQKPTISVSNINTNNDAGNCTATVSLGTPVTGDNCGVASVVNNHPSTSYPVGTTVVTWTVTDIHGNQSTATQTVTVTDNEAPKANCKPVTVTLVNGAASISVGDVNNNSTDNCGIASVTVSKSSFGCSNIGANTVTLTVTDIHGNVSTCNATVTVVGEIPGCTIASIPTGNVYTGGVSTNLYLGYGAQSTTLAVTPAANGAPYTYSWSGNGLGMLSSTTSGSPVFTPTVAGSYTFTVVTTNKYGCTTSCSITICVADIRVPGTDGKKVYVCHVPSGNTGNPQTLSISVNAVSSHLGIHAGDRLGSCDMVPCGVSTVAKNSTTNTQSVSQEKSSIVPAEEELKITVMPNPTTTHFRLKLESKYQTAVSIKVMDATGRVIDAKSKINANSTIEIGHTYISGTYYAEMIQGTTRKVVQLIKVGK